MPVEARPASSGLAEAQDKIVVEESRCGALCRGRRLWSASVVVRALGRHVILAYVGALARRVVVLVAAVAALGWSEGRGALAALGASWSSITAYYGSSGIKSNTHH